MKRITCILISLLLVLSLIPCMAFAAGTPRLLSEFIPSGKLEAPQKPYLKLDTSWPQGDVISMWVMTPSDISKIVAAGQLWDAENPYGENMTRNRFDVEWYEFRIQTDGRVDGGSWQYTSDWDDPEFWRLEGIGDYVFGTVRDFYGDSQLVSFDLSDVGAWHTDNGNNNGFLNPILTPFTDGDGDTAFRYDLANHSLGVRCRIMLKYVAEPDGPIQTIITPWSPETVIGKGGNQKALTEPTGIEAPTLSDFQLKVTKDPSGLEGASAEFFIDIPDSVYDGLMYCEAEAGMFEPYNIETQIRVNGGSWVDFYIGNSDWIFDGLRSGSPDTDYPFTKDSQVEIRARIVNNLGQQSPWSNIVGNKPSFQASAWAQSELAEADALGLIPASLKDQDLTKKITRAEFAAVSVKVFEALTSTTAQPVANNPFTDTSDPEVLKAFNVGITDGKNSKGDLFGPNDLLTREQAATMLTRVWKKVNFSGWTLKTDGNFDAQFKAAYSMPAKFDDDAKISPWAYDSVYFMAANHIVEGSNGTFKPRAVTDAEKAIGYAQATREQALAIAVRMVKNLQ
jgi:hypothetical protein